MRRLLRGKRARERRLHARPGDLGVRRFRAVCSAAGGGCDGVASRVKVRRGPPSCVCRVRCLPARAAPSCVWAAHRATQGRRRGMCSG
eukprot:1494047-Prymnesium_polylepis.1